MVNVVEVVLELKADGFINGGRPTSGRVVRSPLYSHYAIEVDDTVRGVVMPSGLFDTVDEARDALMQFWEECNDGLMNHPYWTPIRGR